jgi:uncharacterized membrane-anchored protein YitT (DUF2179 family)
MDTQSIGRIMLVIGIVIAILGGLLIVFGQSSILSRLGNLPGDIRLEGQGFSCFVPIVSMILASIVLTVVLNIVIRLINRP